MNHSPSAPRTPDRPEGEPAPKTAQHRAHDEERFGPLALQRTHKDDGRLLIFFWAEAAGRE